MDFLESRRVYTDTDIGYIYCLSNPAMPGLVKIGYTNRNVALRVHELSYGVKGASATGVPLPFKMEKQWQVPATKAKEIEQTIHAHLHSARINEGREFFQISVTEAVDEIDEIIFSLDVVKTLDDRLRREKEMLNIEQAIRNRIALLEKQTAEEANQKVAQFRQSIETKYAAINRWHGVKWGTIFSFATGVIASEATHADDTAAWVIAIFVFVLVYFASHRTPLERYQASTQYKQAIAAILAQSNDEGQREIEIMKSWSIEDKERILDDRIKRQEPIRRTTGRQQ